MKRGGSGGRRYGKRNGDGGEDHGPNGYQEIPYRDALLESGEVPLHEIDAFVIPARDENGVGQHISLNIPPYMYRQMQISLRSMRFPYLDIQYLIRHAIHRHMYFLTEIRSSLPSHILSECESLIEVSRDQEFRTRSREAFEAVSNQIEKYCTDGERGEATRLLARVRQAMEGVQSSPWKSRFMVQLMRRYSHLISVADGGTAPESLNTITGAVNGSTDHESAPKFH